MLEFARELVTSVALPTVWLFALGRALWLLVVVALLTAPDVAGRAVEEVAGRAVAEEVAGRAVAEEVAGRAVAEEVAGRAVAEEVAGRAVLFVEGAT